MVDAVPAAPLTVSHPKNRWRLISDRARTQLVLAATIITILLVLATGVATGYTPMIVMAAFAAALIIVAVAVLEAALRNRSAKALIVIGILLSTSTVVFSFYNRGETFVENATCKPKAADDRTQSIPMDYIIRSLPSSAFYSSIFDGADCSINGGNIVLDLRDIGKGFAADPTLPQTIRYPYRLDKNKKMIVPSLDKNLVVNVSARVKIGRITILRPTNLGIKVDKYVNGGSDGPEDFGVTPASPVHVLVDASAVIGSVDVKTVSP
jgi:hypothetical protein